MWAIFLELAIALPLVLWVLYALRKSANNPDAVIDSPEHQPETPHPPTRNPHD